MDLSVERSWTYRGEGNSCLVIASQYDNIVYRFMKRRVDGDSKKDTSSSIKEIVQRKIDYVEHVMRPLLGHEYVQSRTLVEVPLEFVESLNCKFRHLRPVSRLDTEVCTTYAERSLDFCRLPIQPKEDNIPTFCVEIKPKAGFLPTCYVSNSSNIKYTVCRHCLHQKLKVKKGKWTSISSYCPVDLCSGDARRMKYALLSLILNPQNNLRIFKDGKFLYGCKSNELPTTDDRTHLYNHLQSYFGAIEREDTDDVDVTQSSTIQSLQDVIVSALLSTTNTANNCQHSSKRRKTEIKSHIRCAASGYYRQSHSITDESDSCLPKGCVLYNVLKVQQFDDLDIERIYPIYSRIQEQLKKNPTYYREKRNLDSSYKKDYFSTIDGSSSTNGHNDIRQIERFLVATTAKDCSIMIALTPVDKNNSDSHGTDDRPMLEDKFGNKFHYSIKLADLDPKQFTKIPHYYELDKRIVKEYMKDVNNDASVEK